MKEVISLVDKNYRTLAVAESRGVAGFSMGGYGALYLAMKYPEVFGSVFSFGGAFFRPDRLTDVVEGWRDSFGGAMAICIDAYSAAFTAKKNVPQFNGSEEDNLVIEEWLNGMSNWEDKTDRYLEQEARLNGIKICYGKDDIWKWLIDGAQYVSDVLSDNNIEHELKILEGGHNITTKLAQEEMLPFFAETLVFE